MFVGQFEGGKREFGYARRMQAEGLLFPMTPSHCIIWPVRNDEVISRWGNRRFDTATRPCAAQGRVVI